MQAEQQWPGLHALVRVQVERCPLDPTVPLTRPATEVRYYLLSHTMSAQSFGAAVRSHWGTENQVHWVLDVTFHEDAFHIRAGHAADNVAALRQTTATASPSPRSLKAKRL